MTDDESRPAPIPKLASVVIPVFNEAESLPLLLRELRAAFAEIPEVPFEVIFVDDGSRDASWATICELADDRVRGLRFRRNFGKAAALQAGFAASRGEVVFTLDADLQDDPKEIPSFLSKLSSDGLDLISGYKQVRHDPWHKVFPSRVFNGAISWLTGVKLHDHNCGFKCYRADVVRRVRLYGELHRFIPVLAAAEGFRVGEKVVQHRARRFGRSKFGASRFLKGLLDLLQVHFRTTYGRRPLHFFGTAAFLLFGVALLGTVATTLIPGNWIATPIMILAIVAGSGVFPALVAGYLGELLAAQRRDVPYDVSERTE